MLRRHSAVITLLLCETCSALTVRVSGPIRRPAIQRTAAACFVACKEESDAPDRRPPALALMGAAALLAVAMPLAAGADGLVAALDPVQVADGIQALLGETPRRRQWNI